VQRGKGPTSALAYVPVTEPRHAKSIRGLVLDAVKPHSQVLLLSKADHT